MANVDEVTTDGFGQESLTVPAAAVRNRFLPPTPIGLPYQFSQVDQPGSSASFVLSNSSRSNLPKHRKIESGGRCILIQARNDQHNYPMSTLTENDHSILADPAFKLLADIRHAKNCADKMMLQYGVNSRNFQTDCVFSTCTETKNLLQHVIACSDANCATKDCKLSRVLTEHENDLHDDSSLCPICHKQRVIQRLHPGKAPRTEDSDEEENDVARRDLRIRFDPYWRRKEANLRRKRSAEVWLSDVLSRSDAQKIRRRELSRQLEHAVGCTLNDCGTPNCIEAKKLLHHMNTCQSQTCEFNEFHELLVNVFDPNCRFMTSLNNHIKLCNPLKKQCSYCCKKPYKGKDYFADLPEDLLRTIAKKINIRYTKSLNAFKSVNKRVHTFFDTEKGPKRQFSFLVIDQLLNGSVRFQFLNNGVSDGYMHIVTNSGEEERIRYCAKKKAAAIRHVKSKYGFLTRKPNPIPLPPVLYNALEAALHKFSYDNLCLEWVIINTAMLKKIAQ